jgi:cytoskeletal protein CcmA (bactofilin family)
MLRRGAEQPALSGKIPDRVNSVLGSGIAWRGSISGTGGVRIEGAFDGDIAMRGLVVIGESGRVTCEHIRAVTLLISGSVKGNITARRVEITRTGRVWGDVVTTSFSTEEGAFLRGKITMEEELDIGLGQEPAPEEVETEVSPDDESPPEK